MSELKYYSGKDIAKILSVSPETVRGWLFKKKMPPPDISESKFTRWKEETIKPFLNNPMQWRKENCQTK